MKVCFIVSEFFGWGKYGGYGSATRVLATELARRGIDVTVVTPARGDQPEREDVAGVTVLAHRPQSLKRQYELLRECRADVYHSQEPSLGTWLALKAAPERTHIVTCRDTRVSADWLIEMRAWILDRSFQTLLTFPYENNPMVARAVRAAHAVYCPNHFSREIARQKYRLTLLPGFLPTPVLPPTVPLVKSARPTVCYIGRWDRRKRPELFFELASRFPDVSFIAVGQARSASRTAELMQRYSGIRNLRLEGFVDQFASDRLQRILSESWILVNTSLREGLPRSFLEAAHFKCAILSRVDPEQFASGFGQRVADDDFAGGLRGLLEHDAWRARGEAAYSYVSEQYGFEAAINRHLNAYRQAAAL